MNIFNSALLYPSSTAQAQRPGPRALSETVQHQMFFSGGLRNTHVQHTVIRTGSHSLRTGKKIKALLKLRSPLWHPASNQAGSVGFCLFLQSCLWTVPPAASQGRGTIQCTSWMRIASCAAKHTKFKPRCSTSGVQPDRSMAPQQHPAAA